jgi:tRNA pseudouridine synthase 10
MVTDEECWLCSGLFREISHFVELIIESLQCYEFDTFLIGSKIEDEIIEKEEEFLESTSSEYAEPLKTELNREIGKRVEKKLDKRVDFIDPDIMAIIDTAFDVVRLQIKPLFIYGRYKKFVRGIPQTKWHCRLCHGKGCRRCNYSGKLYNISVEELIAKHFLDVTLGNGEVFHGCGREDIDARMLGNGRPFVLEIKDPKVRSIDLCQVKQKINRVNKNNIEVEDLRFTTKEQVATIKNARYKKEYRVVFQGEKPINKEKLKKAAESLRDKTIRQYTPSRVVHRRTDKVRQRKIFDCKIESIHSRVGCMTVEADSGTYIKELVSGDQGRTTPSLSELLSVPCKVKELDVIMVKGGIESGEKISRHKKQK